MARAEGHRLRAGTYTSGSITSTYAVTAWPLQTDQVYVSGGDTLWPWLAPNQAPPPARARIADTLDGGQAADGFYQWEWAFDYWTFNMYDYFLDTYLATTGESGLVSVMAYDTNDAAIYLNATVLKPRLGQDLELEVGGWKNIKLRFRMGVIVT